MYQLPEVFKYYSFINEYHYAPLQLYRNYGPVNLTLRFDWESSETGVNRNKLHDFRMILEYSWNLIQWKKHSVFNCIKTKIRVRVFQMMFSLFVFLSGHFCVVILLFTRNCSRLHFIFKLLGHHDRKQISSISCVKLYT